MTANLPLLANAPSHTSSSTFPAPHEALSIIEGLEAQLHALYAEREESGGHAPDTLLAMITGLKAQLHSLYEERSAPGHLAAESALENLEQAAMDFELQLAALYEESAGGRFSATEDNHMVDSLERQVAALIEERDSLGAELETSRTEIQVNRAKARSLVAAVVDRVLA